MSKGDPRHVRGRIVRWLSVGLVLAVLAAAAATYHFDLGERWLGVTRADPAHNPAAVAPPAGLELPDLPPAASVADPIEPSGAGTLSERAVRRAIGRQFENQDLGKRFAASISPLSGGAPVMVAGSGASIPASTTKLLTAMAALEAIDPGTTFATRVVRTGPGAIVLVGGGDPYLASKPVAPADRASTYPARADIVTLARRTASALRADQVGSVRLAYDDSLFTGPDVSRGWEPTYLPEGVVPPITALWVDRGSDAGGPVPDPSRRAAEVFAAALGRAGIAVRGAPVTRVAGSGATELARVESAPVEQIVQHVLDVSDNEGAEVLAHQVGLAVAGEASFAGGVRGVLATLKKLGVDTGGAVLYDGSGLSRRGRLRPATLVDVLRTAADPSRPELRPVLEGLPVAGFTGSLADRFADADPAAGGRVRTKTGTLTGVHALAGLVSDLDGNVMVVVLIANRVPVVDTLAARAALDEAAASLAGCHCGAAA
ncbi:D-alanyl-D-alanine carboxypeptidase/D-alanyl-D-alanine endopeptidase [Nocardioides sp.]|uniref:D-alanyl-D-alanine carboxypeptidase/D-alanyl-D-alanine endopeptidase n=1 Tax=Nocardioides sp. TaxID=35761 RepID=UPI003D0F0392